MHVEQLQRPQRLIRNPDAFRPTRAPEPEPHDEAPLHDLAPDLDRGPRYRLPLIIAAVAASLGLLVAVAI